MTRSYGRFPPLRAILPPAVLTLALLAALASAGCDPEAEYQVGPTARYQGVWWTGEGSFAVVQLTAADGKPVVLAWDKRVGKTLAQQKGYRVVAVEQAAPRVWLEPDTGLHTSPSKYVGADLADDALDAPPQQLLVWDLASPNKPPTDDAEARWRAWPGPGGHTAFLEVDVLRGALPSRLLFQPSSGETEGSKATLPEGVNTFHPVGWSPSGKRFAVRTVDPESPSLLVFSAATGALESSQTLDPARPQAAWAEGTDDVVMWMGSNVMTYTAGDRHAALYAPASSYAPAPDSILLGTVPAGPVVWQRQGGDAGVWVLGDPMTGGNAQSVLEGAPAAVAYDRNGGLAVFENDPPRLVVGKVGVQGETVWEAGR